MSDFWQAIQPALTAKLEPSHVQKAKKYGPKGDYIEGWHAIAEANRIFGFGGWSYNVVSLDCVHQGPREIGEQRKPGFGVTYTARIVVRVGGVEREDVGAGHGYDVDCGLAHESAIKEAVTDALKRALRTFGNPFGLALYDKSRENVGTNPVDDMMGFRAQINAAIENINAQTDLEGLGAYWKALTANARGVALDAEVTRAKDAKKEALTREAA
jgi:DNA recombination protein Rad52